MFVKLKLNEIVKVLKLIDAALIVRHETVELKIFFVTIELDANTFPETSAPVLESPNVLIPTGPGKNNTFENV